MSRMTIAGGWFLVVIALSGCASLKLGKNDHPVADAAATYPPPATVAIEFTAAGGKKKVQEVPIEKGTTVGDVLDKTKANRKFRRSTVAIQRTAPGGIPHKMPIEFSNDSHRVGHSTNYDLHPNDRILITEDTSTILDDLIKKYL
jgi:hypothetical protein